MDWLATLDARDVFYGVVGSAFLGFTWLPRVRFLTVPIVYVAVGALLVLAGMPVINPLAGGEAGWVPLAVVEHATELIVIVSIAGAGLAVDRKLGRKSWHHTWMLLAVTMPLTIGALAWVGWGWVGLPWGTAILLGAALSPTDPVLARSVQVSGPNQGEEHDIRVSLTTEAGLNDALAFPFVYLAIAVSIAWGGAGGGAGGGGEGSAEYWWVSWLGFDVVYRLAAAVGVGWGVGHLISRYAFSRGGDAKRGGENAGLMLMAGTFLTYGIAEAVDAYGFLAVFVAARTHRAFAQNTEHEDYPRAPHYFSDQVEKIILSLLLIWLGGFCAAGLFAELTWAEAAVAVGLIVVVRPVAGWVALRPTRGSAMDHFAISTLGLRGFGTVFYVAYAQSHHEFEQIDAVWRIGVLAIVVSIVVHGVLVEWMKKHFA